MVKTEVTGTEKSKLFPTDIGMVVTDFLEEHFSSILEYSFTASVEKEFDEIADGKLQWQKMLAAFYEPFHSTITHATENSQYTKTERLLGVDPKSGKNVYAKVGRFGPMVQLGEATEEGEKPKYAGLQTGQLVATIELADALSLFNLPRTLGQLEDKDVVIGIGRFGAYARYDGKFTSLKKEDDPYTVTLERAIELIRDKELQEKNKNISTFGDILVLNGRYGPYISFNKQNYKIVKGKDAATLTEADCKQIIADAQKNPTPKKVVRAKKK